MKLNPYILLAGFLALVSCKTEQKTGELVGVPKETKNCTALLKDPQKFASVSELPFSIKDVKIEFNCLFMTLDYQGTGKELTELFWDGNIMKSLPPKIGVAVKIQKGSASDKSISRKICFNFNEIYKQFEDSGCYILLKDYKDPLFLKGISK